MTLDRHLSFFTARASAKRFIMSKFIDNEAVEDKPENPKPTTSKQKKKPPVTRIVSDDDESDYEKPTAEDNEFIDDSMAECAADRSRKGVKTNCN